MTWPYRQDSSAGSYLCLLPAFWEENRHTSLPLKNQPCVFKFLIVSTRNYCSLYKKKLFLENINMNKQLVLKCIWKEHIILFLNFFLELKIFFFLLHNILVIDSPLSIAPSSSPHILLLFCSLSLIGNEQASKRY